ncbi:flagellar biosynthesis repressor FlbT [Arenibaculum sp.]|jgi:flagellar biosynthesis regulator FlbT|uniref:flagellar biosynthesis repressor FlbT n=1 Tax=Arenibaculum sp. TaxID=2865862 RepID=UPI002E101383|nr:flagellar biosynthesis repressor FlbT [Arenibaculum sp.]
MTDKIEMKTLALKPGETVLLNSVPLRLTEAGQLEVPADVRVLTREQLIVDAGKADTVAKRIYFVLQAMNLDPQNYAAYRDELLELLSQRAERSELQPILRSLATIEQLSHAQDFTAAMDLCRHLIEFDDAVMRDFPQATEAA